MKHVAPTITTIITADTSALVGGDDMETLKTQFQASGFPCQARAHIEADWAGALIDFDGTGPAQEIMDQVIKANRPALRTRDFIVHTSDDQESVFNL